MQEPSFVCAETLNQLLVGQSCRGPALWPRSGISGWGRAVCVPEKHKSQQGRAALALGRKESRVPTVPSPALCLLSGGTRRQARPRPGVDPANHVANHLARLQTPYSLHCTFCCLLTSYFFSFLVSSLLFFLSFFREIIKYTILKIFYQSEPTKL